MLRALGLGDLLTAVPALRGLAAAFPEHEVVLAAPPSLAPLATMSGAVDEVVGLDLRAEGAPAPLRRAGAAARRALRGADIAVNLHGCGPQSSTLLLAQRPQRLVAFAHPDLPATQHGPAWREDEHEVVRWCRLLRTAGIAADPADLDLRVLASQAPPVSAGYTLLHPGAASPARRWPARRWAAVACAEISAGREVILTAGPGEEALALDVARRARLDPSALRVPTSVGALAGWVAAAGRVACGDTGVAHLATAVGTPSVVLFGPTSPARWGPPASRPQHRVLWHARPGDPPGDPHAAEPDPRLLRITSDEVTAALAATDSLTRGGPEPRDSWRIPVAYDRNPPRMAGLDGEELSRRRRQCG